MPPSGEYAISDKNRDANRLQLSFPTEVDTMPALNAQQTPYMEASVGIENILKIFQVELSWRQLPGQPAGQEVLRRFGVPLFLKIQQSIYGLRIFGRWNFCSVRCTWGEHVRCCSGNQGQIAKPMHTHAPTKAPTVHNLNPKQMAFNNPNLYITFKSIWFSSRQMGLPTHVAPCAKNQFRPFWKARFLRLFRVAGSLNRPHLPRAEGNFGRSSPPQKRFKLINLFPKKLFQVRHLCLSLNSF